MPWLVGNLLECIGSVPLHYEVPPREQATSWGSWIQDFAKELVGIGFRV